MEQNKSTLPPQIPADPTTESHRDKLYRIAYNCLGVDMAPLNDMFGCAEALSYVLLKAEVPGLHKAEQSTAMLALWFKNHLTEVAEPLPGDIIISPTGGGNGTVRGHCGIVGRNSIMSNNSLSGRWDTQWVLKDWIAYYERKGGIPTRYYRWI